VDLGAVSATLS